MEPPRGARKPQDDPIAGPIEGLRLPARAWTALRQENITTLDRLRAVADRLDRLQGIGAKTAQTIRAELARVAALEKPRHYKPGSWNLDSAN
jgi:DNA-directed RNA polymerase alpha subunit